MELRDKRPSKFKLKQPMKNILVPIDFSTVSQNAVNYAVGLARCMKARLILYYVYSLPGPVGDAPITFIDPQEFEKSNLKRLHALDKKLKAKHGKIETELLDEQGFVVDAITRFTQKHKIDAVVMGVTGAGKNPGLLGSNTTAVMHRIASPVLVIPKGCEFKKPSSIALACDFKSILPDEVIDKFKFFAHLFHSKVLIFNVIKKDELENYPKAAAEVNLENMLTDVKHTIHFSSGTNLPEEINTFIKKHTIDMLVMFPHQYNLIEGLFHRSATREMAFLTKVPLLSIYE